jgi:hypothetical protein
MATGNNKRKIIMQYVVIDHEGAVSWDAETEEPEKFAEYEKAEERAKEIAEAEPGAVIKIFELTGEVVAPVGEVQCRRIRHD